MCRPLGACLAFRGIEDSMVLLHGSQGCSTYMRRYISSHFREPVDIASSSLSEKSAVYGGAESLKRGVKNVVDRYSPRVLGIATTCLTETIGDDVELIIGELLRDEPALREVEIIPVSTPSYSGGHYNGFHDSCVALISRLAQGGPRGDGVNLFPGFLSPADIRHLKDVMDGFGLSAVIIPDISETLDGGIVDSYRRIPAGGTPLEAVRRTGTAAFSLEFSAATPGRQSAALLLKESFSVPAERLPAPIGISYSDRFFQAVSRRAGRPVPEHFARQRERLLDAMVDAHKYLSGKRAAVYGDPDFVLGLSSFLADVGVVPAVIASGGGGREFISELELACAHLEDPPEILTYTDFGEIARAAAASGVDLLVGTSKGNHIARELQVPLMRAGFPIHDRIGGQRMLHVGYAGAMALLDLLTNTIIAGAQDELGYGYSYM